MVLISFQKTKKKQYSNSPEFKTKLKFGQAEVASQFFYFYF